MTDLPPVPPAPRHHLTEAGVAFGVARTVDMAALIEDVATTRTHVVHIAEQVEDITSALGSESNGHGIRGRLRKLEDARQFNRGALYALHGIWSLLMLASGWLLAHWSQILSVLAK